MTARTRLRPVQCGLLDQRSDEPQWKALPAETRRELIGLLAEMLVRHAAVVEDGAQEGDNDE
jgi:hypothetical protein